MFFWEYSPLQTGKLILRCGQIFPEDGHCKINPDFPTLYKHLSENTFWPTHRGRFVFYWSKENTPWKINMEPTNHPFRKGTWSEPNLHEDTFQLLNCVTQGGSIHICALSMGYERDCLLLAGHPFNVKLIKHILTQSAKFTSGKSLTTAYVLHSKSDK